MSYWLELRAQPVGRSAVAGSTAHAASWHDSSPGSSSGATAIPTPSSDRPRAASASLRVDRPSAASRARSLDGRGRGPAFTGSGWGRLFVIAGKDARPAFELPERGAV